MCSHPKGTPLYSDESEYDDKKFGFVMERVLLPMALDYHIRSRTADVNAVAAAELTNLNGDADAKTAAIQVKTIVTTNVKKNSRRNASSMCQCINN